MSLYGIKDASDLVLISNESKKQVLFANYCNKTNINFSSDDTYAMKKGVKAIGWSQNREGSFEVEMQVFDLKWISILMGSDFTTGITSINKRVVLPVTSGSATLPETPKSGSLAVFKVSDKTGMEQGDEQTVGTTSTANKYSVSGTTLSFNTTTTFATDGYIVAYYLVDSEDTAQTFTVKADEFPTGYSVWANTTIKGEDNVEKAIQFSMNNIKPQSNMELSFDSSDCTTLTCTFDIFADSNNDMFTFKVL
jgi:hypothetical protein